MEGREDVLARELARARRAAGRDRLLDRPMLLGVLRVQPVDRVVAGRPDGRPGERPPCALRELLDQRECGHPVDDVVEGMVAAHPVAHDRAAVVARLERAQLLRDGRESLLGRIELLEVLGCELRRRHLSREPLELRAHHESLVQLVARDRAYSNAAVRDERDEPEGGQPPQGLAHGGARDVELLRELLLPEDGPGRELARDDRLLDHERDVVCLGCVEAHSSRVYAGTVRNSTSSGWSATSANSDLASSPASTSSISCRTTCSSKRPARTHCHTCEREISAVAASSIRLSIAAAPTPCSHASR